MKKKSFVNPPVSFVMSCFSEKKTQGPFILTSDTDEGAVFASVVCHSGRVFQWGRTAAFVPFLFKTQKRHKSGRRRRRRVFGGVAFHSYLDFFFHSFFGPCWSLWKGARAIKNKKEGRNRRGLWPNETKTTLITHGKNRRV